MTVGPNLLATTEPRRESEGCSELWMLLRAVGDNAPAVDRTRIKGLIEATTGLDVLEAVARLRKELEADPGSFKVLLRVLPVEEWVDTGVDAIAEATQRLAERIDENESFRVTLEKRRTELRSLEVINAVALKIDRKVDLEEPDWVVLVEIVGRRTGVSVVPRDGLLNVQKERAGLSP